MKSLKFLVIAAIFALSSNVNAQTTEANPSGLTFKEDTFNFGDIEQDKPASHDFTFVNTSTKTILITGVKPSCGCTATNYTKTPIKPGESGSVTATYNAHNAGPFTKTLTVATNDTEATTTLYIKGKVIANEAAPAVPATHN